MTQYLPSNLLALFAPRDPIPYLPPAQKLPWEKTGGGYQGVSQFVKWFEDSKDTPPPTRVETRDERQERKRKERAEQVAYKLEQDLALWDPQNDPNITGDPYKTLFVGRVNFDSSESKLRREFEMYGPVKKVYLVHDVKTGKPRGYAYVEYEHERDMHSAYKHADGRKIDGRRVLVDVERGRTVKGWRPRRLGGGLGTTRKGGPDVNSKYSGRDDTVKDRSRSRSRRRSRSPRERRRSKERRRRSRSRDKERRRSREKDAVEPREVRDRGEARDESRRRRRSRSRHRSRSRDRKRSRRSRSRERRRSKDRLREPKREPGEDGMVPPEQTGGQGDINDQNEVRVKTEKERGYADEMSAVHQQEGDRAPHKDRSNGMQDHEMQQQQQQQEEEAQQEGEYGGYGGQEVNGGEGYAQEGGYGDEGQ